MRFAGSVRLRPVRIGFLVSPSELAPVRRVMRLCCYVWGGRYNPIIPFLENAPPRWIEHHERANGPSITRGYIDFFEPDVLVEASPGMAEKINWTNGESHFELPRLLPLDNFFQID